MKSTELGVGNDIPSGYLSSSGRSSLAYFSGIPSTGSSYNTHKIFIIFPQIKLTSIMLKQNKLNTTINSN